MFVRGTRLYNSLYANPTGLTIHDIGDPASPRLVASFDAPVQATGVTTDEHGLIAMGRGARGVSLLRTCAECYADCDISTGPGVLDIFDWLCFVDRFNAGLPYACDCDESTGPGACDIFDFLCFGNAFAAGCL